MPDNPIDFTPIKLGFNEQELSAIEHNTPLSTVNTTGPVTGGADFSYIKDVLPVHDENSKARAYIEWSNNKSPQKEAMLKTRSESSGIPIEVLRSLPSLDYIDKYGKDRILKNQRLLRHFSENPSNAAISKNDVEKLEELSNQLKTIERVIQGKEFSLPDRLVYARGMSYEYAARLGELPPEYMYTLKNQPTFGGVLGEMGAYADFVTDQVKKPFKEAITEPAQAGYYNSKISKLHFDELVTGNDNRESIAALEEKIKFYEEPDGFKYLAASFFKQIGQYSSGVRDVVFSSLFGATTGGAMALAAGNVSPAVLAPEEVVTVPTAIISGGITGAKVGFSKHMFEVEAGSAYAELKDIKVDGQTLDPTVTKVTALSVGAVNAALEYLGIRGLTSGAKGIIGLNGKIKDATKRVVKRALSNPALRNELVKVAGNYAKGITTETATEIAQEGTNIIASYFAQNVDEFINDKDFKNTFWTPEDTQRIIAIATETSAATVFGGLLPVSVRVAKEAYMSVEAGDTATTLKELKNNVDDTTTKQVSPETMRSFIENSGRNQDIEIDVREAEILYQDNKDAFNKLGIDREVINKALAEGQDLDTRLSDVLIKLDNDESFDRISQIIRLKPRGFTSAESVTSNPVELARRTIDEVEVYADQERALNTELSRLQNEIIEAGGSKDYAQAVSDVWKAFSYRMGIEGQKLNEVISKVKVLSKNDQALQAVAETTNGRAAVAIHDGQYLISLLNQSDVSSMVHETGHIFLKEMQALVDSETASYRIKQDWSNIMQFLEATSDKGLTLEGEEKFARSFEAYLREGRAPSKSLETAFGRFRQWLTNVYKSAVSLGTSLTPAITNTFDRMLATESEIYAAAAESGLGIFTRDQMKGLNLSPEDKTHYENLIKAGRDRAINNAQLAKDRRYNRELRHLRALAREQAESLPVYQAEQFIVDNKGLNEAEIRALYGDEFTDTIKEVNPKLLDNTSNLSLERAAFESGYNNVDDMILDLANYESIDSVTANLVKEYRSSLDAEFSEATIESYIEAGEVIDIMGKFLEKAASGVERRQDTAEIKQYVSRELNAKPLREALRVDKYLGSINRANKAMKRAMVKGDYEAALTESNRLRLSHEMVTQARRMKDDIISDLNRIRVEVSAKRGTVDSSYLSNLKSVAHRFQVGTPSVNKLGVEKSTPLANLLKGDIGIMDAGGLFSDWLKDETYVKNYKDLTYKDFKEVQHLIDFLYDRGKKAIGDVITSEGLAIDNIVEDISKRVSSLRGQKKYNTDSFFTKAINSGRGIMADSQMFLYILRNIDAYSFRSNGVEGPAETYIYDPLEKAWSTKANLLDSVQQELLPSFKQLEKSIREKPNVVAGLRIPEAFANAKDGYRNWTYERVVAAALNMGNEGNIDALKKGYGLSDADIDSIKSVLSVDDWYAIQNVWNTLDGLWDSVSTEFEKLNFYKPEKVQPKSFNVQGPNGELITLEGGYYPIVNDSTLLNKFTEEDNLWDAATSSFASPEVKRSFMIERVGSSDLAPRLSLSVLSSHLDYVTSYIAYASPIQDASNIINNKTFRDTVINKLGEQTYNQLNATLRGIVGTEIQSISAFDRFIEKQKNLGTLYTLGLNARAAAKQPLSIFGAINDYGFKAIKDGFMAIVKDPVGSYRNMVELSTYMKHRDEYFSRDYTNAIASIKGQSKVARASREAVAVSMSMIKTMDFITVFPIWQGAFNKGMTMFNGNAEKAVTYADKAVSSTQPSSRPIDMSTIQRSKKGVHRLFTAFGSYRFKFGNRLRADYNAWREGRITNLQFTKTLTLELFTPAIASTLLAYYLAGKDPFEEDNRGALAIDIVAYGFSGIPYVSDLTNVVTRKAKGQPTRDVGSSIAFKGAELTTDFASNIIKAMNDDDTWENTVWSLSDLISYSVGVPASKIAKDTTNFVKEHEDDDFDF